MVLLGIKSDSRTIHVRTDDLSPEERDRVHECADIIHRFKCRDGDGIATGFIVFFGILVVACIIGAYEAGNDHTAAKVVVFSAIVGAVIAALFGRAITERNDKRTTGDVQTLLANMQSSSRCDEFMQDYKRDSVLLKRLLADHLKSATCST